MFTNDKEEKIIDLLIDINKITSECVKGPNCLDPKICDGKCCNTSPEIPKVIHDLHLEKNLSVRSNYEKSNTCAFRIKENYVEKRCEFFIKETNTCRLWLSNLRPPQCCLFPINFSENHHICSNNFKFLFSEDTSQILKKKMQEYIDLTNEEYKWLISKHSIESRLENTLMPKLKITPPTKFIGIIDSYGSILPMISDRTSYELIELCETSGCERDYFECLGLCENLMSQVQEIILKTLPPFYQRGNTQDEIKFQSLKALEANEEVK